MIVGASGMSYGGDETSSDSLQAQQYLLAQAPQRSRSLSDTSLRPPTWDTMPMMGGHQGAGMSADGGLLGSHDGRRPASAGTVNMNDVLPGPPSSNPLFQSQGPSLRTQSLRHPASAGPTQNSFGPQSLQPTLSNQFGFSGLNPNFGNNDFLSPDVAAVNLRRVKSDSRGHRAVRSEDFGYGSQSSSPFLNPNGMLVPPPSVTQQEFLRNAATRQFLHPAEPVASIRGHHRRASSGSRERPGMGGVTGWSSGGSSARASPYPSPSASPRPGYGPLPDIGGMPMNVSMTAMHRTPSGTMMTTDMNMNMNGGMGTMDTTTVPTHIAKVNVTTPSTADASQKRRKQPANFVCPVPGCGSTFTRHFNLKGESRRVSYVSYSAVELTCRCVLQDIYGLMRKRNRSSASGLGVAKASRGNTTASDTSSCISTSARILARDVRRTLLAWTRLIGTVSAFMIVVSVHGSSQSSHSTVRRRCGMSEDPG